MDALYLAYGITGLFILLYILYLIKTRKELKSELNRLEELSRREGGH